MRLKDYIEQAENAGACREALEELMRCKSIKEALNLNKAPYYSYVYARDIIKGRFKLGEGAISKDKYYSILYKKFLEGLQ
jgi:hypothetical protein